MRAIPGHRLLITGGVVAILGLGGGAAYALSASADRGTGEPLGARQPAVSATTATPSPSQPTTSPSPSPSQSSPQPSASTTTATSPATTPATSKPATAAAPGCETGEHQREVEELLAQLGGYGTVEVDGVQSVADCAAIKAFQKRFGISPPAGRAGPLTLNVARRIAGSATAAQQGACGAGSELTVCVDLTRQTVWAVRGGTVVLGPTVTRTGMAGYATPAGTFRVYNKNVKEWSVPYKVWLPYWQAFNGGMGLHETTTYIHDMSMGSHGCVNLLHADAVAFWNLTAKGTTVKVFGHRSGT